MSSSGISNERYAGEVFTLGPLNSLFRKPEISVSRMPSWWPRTTWMADGQHKAHIQTNGPTHGKQTVDGDVSEAKHGGP